MSKISSPNSLNDSEIAIIGMSCRFPGAKDTEIFWQSLQDGVESIYFFDHQELLSSGVDPDLPNKPNYVKATGLLSDIELFDAFFFDFSAREAEILDPQHRLFLECAWEAIESAGYDPETYECSIGVYAGTGYNTYLLNNLYRNFVLSKSIDDFQLFIGNDKDFLPTRVSYKLNLNGPSVNVQTACSTSLVAVHLACQSILNGECDVALAGGVSVFVPQKAGYLYQEGMIFSPDGHCRAFDAKAQGTIMGNGVGIVVLKRLEDALAEGDCIHAVIKGSAINNDGSGKVGFTAPSVGGQAKVIAEAQAIAGVETETITYIETHGTGTTLGDPIEVAALSQAFSVGTQKKGFCAIGSVKTNVGHLNSAAGVAGLIKTVLALKHKMIPPSLHFEQPNPEIDFDNSPFYVNTKLSEWKTNGTPRRAGVSSFGFGGTNAHVVLEETPTQPPSGKSRPWQLLLISAKTSSALETATANLAKHLKQHPTLNLADVVYTLQVGRRAFDYRRMIVCPTLDDAVKALESSEPQRVFTHHHRPRYRPIVFMFSGQGAQYVNMAWELYQVEPTFREQVDACSDILNSHLGFDLRQVLYPSAEQTEAAQQQLQQTAITQPALFVIEYALAKLWMEWGVCPAAMIGHSIGEYVAATLAGVFSLEDALALVTARGQLMQQLPSGSMLAVPLSEKEVQPLLDKTLSVAAINGPSSCVVSGPTPAIEALQNQLADQGIDFRRLHTSHAFHSQMMEPILQPFIERVKQVNLEPPQIPYLSNVTGAWITAQEATSPSYWAAHLRQTVRFAEGLQDLLTEPAQILLEVGPGWTLSKLARRHPDKHPEQVVLTSVRHLQQNQSDMPFLLNTLGQLWLSGIRVNWSGFYAHELRYRLPLPTYPFERQRYWIDAQKTLHPGRQFQPLPTAPELWESVVEAGRLQACSGISEFEEQTYLESKQWLDRLCTAYMNLALRRLGAFSSLSQKYSLENLFEQCQIIPRYRQLLYRWLQVLVEQKHLQQDGSLFTNLVPRSTKSVNELAEEVRVRWAFTPKVVDLVQLCGENLAAVLIGEKEPLEFFNVLIYNAKNFYPEIPYLAYYNTIMQVSLEQIVKSLPPWINLRILEIGAGMGLTTTALLPVLPPKQTSYTFTDIGSGFLTQAKQKLGNYPFVKYRLLDIEKPPTEQGYSKYSFDIVVAANVLHATQNIEETLKHVHSLLAPGGILLLYEITRPQLDFDITWGLLVKPVEDEQRNRGNPFLSKEQWQEALRKHGFVEVEAFSETEAFGQHILVAQASTLAASSVPAAFTTIFEQKGAGQTPSGSLGKKPDIADWFYIPAWKPSILPKPSDAVIKTTRPECCLVFIDEYGLGNKIARRLELEGQDVINIRVGSQFSSEGESPTQRTGKRLYTINPRKQDDYNTLLRELKALDLIPKNVVHLWSVTSHGYTASGLDKIDQDQEKRFHSLLFLAQALGKQNFTDELQITVISNNLQAVTGEEILCPEKATLLGPVKVIPLEYPNIRCRTIDIFLPSSGSWQEEKLLNYLLADLTVNTSDDAIAYRGVHRWVQSFEPIRLDETFKETSRLRKGGVYLITGGLGAIGFTLASYLARTVQAKLLLTGRTTFPTRDNWEDWLINHNEDDDVSHKIRKVQELEKLGAEVLVASTNVANLQQMQEALSQAQQQFGQFNGVIHCAGVLGDGSIQQKTLEQLESVLEPKVRGTLVLNALFKDIQLDFFALCSSISSFKPIFGQVAYAGANNFLDAFAYYKTSTDGTFTVSINWYGWKEGGMGVEGTKRFAQAPALSMPQSKLVTHPLFDQCLTEDPQQELYISNLSVSKHWVLDEHRLIGKATLPGTGYLEMARAACEKYAQNGMLEIREVTFLNSLVVEEDEQKEVRTFLKKQGDDLEFWIMSQSKSGSEQWQEHVRGKIIYIEAQPPKKYKIQEIEAKCDEQERIISEQVFKTQTEFLKIGARWNSLKRIKFGENQGLALLEMSEVFDDDFKLYKLHPALLDLATGFLISEFQQENEDLYLPLSYKRLIVKGALPAKIYSYIRAAENNHSKEETLTFNITIMDEQGTELVEIEEYTVRKVNKRRTDATAKKSGPQSRKMAVVPESENFYLSISSPGILDTLKYCPTTRRKPNLGEVEIEVGATGLNFQEVLIAMGLLPIPAESVFKFGLECAGKIVACGEGVEGFKLGDEVVAFGRSCFSRFITTSAKLVLPKPDHLSLEEAATIPSAFGTAYYSLIKVGSLCKGERVLIHSAAGGVGMAAVQIAQWVGAEIFATAGNAEKRDFLRSKGVKHVMDSRSLAFIDELMEKTNGRGMDVVLNSLGGEFIPKSLSILAPYGRFLELGLRDILNNSQLGLRPFEKNLTFSAIHIDRENPIFSSLCREVMQLFNSENFSPLPHRVFPIAEVTDAFEYMAKGKHIGKIIVSQQDKEALRMLMAAEDRVSQEAREPAASPFPILSSVPSTTSTFGFDLLQKPAAAVNKFQRDCREDWLSPSEGIEVFCRILGSTLPQVLVSTSNLSTWDEQNNKYNPLSSLGLLDKASLSKSTQQIHSRPELNNEYVAPKNEVEQTIADIWQEVLGIEVGRHDNFFELGGDSLLIVQVRSKLQEKLQKEFSIADAFEYPTISALAEYLSGEQIGESAFQQVNERANKLQEAIEEDKQLIEQRRKARE